ncbi:HlyD family secretion protein [Symbiobacterium terraclitae]|uniref:HlyD family secretion protein n=1 Tax=Symbiobacterium terraclitae TaxID=557451 RepID=A0ABS4JVN9_9FIRM|nr:HlyD family secretion protein [Symbiobacterium terraclitae]
MRKKVLVAAVLLLSVAVLIWANASGGLPTAGRRDTAQGPAGAPLVRVQTVSRQNLQQEVVAPGVLQASTAHELRAPFSTKSVKLLVGIGDRVEEGQVVAVLDASDLALQVSAQEAQVAQLEAQLSSLYLQQQQAPLQLDQRLEQARAQLLQAEDNLASVLRQDDALRTRLEQARINLTTLQNRSAEGAAATETARKNLMSAEEAYRADPSNPSRRAAYEQAKAAYEEALTKSRDSAAQAAAQLRAAYDELAAAEADYARVSGDNPVAVQLASSQVQAARLALQMAEMEAQAGGTMAEQVRAAELNLQATRSALESLRGKLEQAELKAPAAGTVLAVSVTDGLPAQEMQLLLTIGGLDELKVVVQVDELDIVKVRPGQALSVETNAAPGEVFSGRVTRVAAQATMGGGGSPYFVVEGSVANRADLLRAGVNAEVVIATAERENVIVVPLAAVREQNGEASVLVVEEFTVRVRPVNVGLRTETEVEITEGVEEGEQIVVSPFTLINSLKDGDPVRVETLREAGGEGR